MRYEPSLTDKQIATLLSELDHIIDDDRYPLSPRIQALKEIRAMLRPEPMREPLLPPKVYAPPRATGRRRK